MSNLKCKPLITLFILIIINLYNIIDVGGNGNLRLTISSNLKPGTPFFPGAYS